MFKRVIYMCVYVGLVVTQFRGEMLTLPVFRSSSTLPTGSVLNSSRASSVIFNLRGNKKAVVVTIAISPFKRTREKQPIFYR